MLNVEDDDVTKLYYKDKKAIDNLEDTSENIINDKKFVCLFVYVAALPTHSSQGASEVKDTCLRLVKEFRKGRSCPGGSLLSPSANTAQLTGETIQPQSLSNQIASDAALRHCDSNEYRGQ